MRAWLQSTCVVPLMLTIGQMDAVVEDHPAADGPVVFISESIVDLGSIREGTIATATFTIENRGTEDLLIQDVNATCGCTTVQLTEEERVVRPEERRNITARFDSTGRLGPQRKTVVVTVNDPARPQINLTIKAAVETLFRVVPQPMVYLRSVRRGETLDPLDVFPSEEGRALEKIDVEVPPGLLEYRQETTSDEKGAGGVRLILTVPEEIELGRIEGVMTIRGVVGGETASMPVRVTGQVVGDLIARPAMLQSLSLTPRGRSFAPVTISATGGKPFEILGVNAGPYIDVEVTPRKPGTEFTLKTALSHDAPDGPLAATLSVRTNNGGQPIVEVPIFVNVWPRCVVEPAVALLGQSSNSASRRIRIQAGPSEPLEIDSVSCENPNILAEVDTQEVQMPQVRFVRVGLRGDPPGVDIHTEVVVRTNIAGAAEIRVPVEYTSRS